MFNTPTSTFAIKESLTFELALYARHIVDANFKNRDELLGFCSKRLGALGNGHDKAA